LLLAVGQVQPEPGQPVAGGRVVLLGQRQLLHLHAVRLKKICPDSNFVLDTKEASVSNFPDMTFVYLRFGFGFRNNPKILSDHLKKNRMYMGDGTSWHVYEERCQGL